MFERILALIEWCIKPKILDPKTIKKVLILDLNFLGDMLMSSPVMRALKENIPGVQVDVMVYDFCLPVVQANPYIDRFYPVIMKWPIFAAILARFRGYDLVMQMNTSLKTNLLLFVAGRNQLGYNYRHRGCLLNLRVPTQYRTARNGNRIIENYTLLRKIFYEFPFCGNYDMIFEVDSEYRDIPRHNIVIHASTRQDYDKRRWDQFTGLGDMIVEQYGNVIFTGSYANLGYVEEIRQKMKHKDQSANLVGILGVQEFAELLCSTKLLVTVNTFAMHLGIALKVPTVAIISGTPVSVVAPMGNPLFRYVEDPGLAEYDPETAKYPIRINEITPEQVMAKIKELTC